MKDTPQNDSSEYTNTGFRDGDARAGFGDDAGTRVGRPDGAGSNASAADPNARQAGGAGQAHVAPHDAEGPPHPGQAGTNNSPVAGGIEGSELDGSDAGQGQQQSRLQAASQGVNEGPAAGDERRVDDL
jgi:hypothetical protein